MGLVLLIGLSVISYRSLNDLTQTADEVTNTHLVMSKLEEVLSDFKDVVSGYRGYVLRGKDSYLDIYFEGRQNEVSIRHFIGGLSQIVQAAV